jgi:lantibiotic biosynthesis dehydratase-like protein
MTKEQSHQVVLNGTGWALWRDVCVRSAGFPARRVLALCDAGLADAADEYGHSADAATAYQSAYHAAVAKLPGVFADFATEPQFREAVIWQNLSMAENCLDRLTAESRRNRKGRQRENAVTSYVQRYCLKNDSIGFFGPVGWAYLTEEDEAAVRAGSQLVARRTTYFEAWAIDQIARLLAERDDVFGWLRPRRDPSTLREGNRVHSLRRHPVALSPEQLRMLMRCDGHRTVSELLASPEPDPRAVLDGLRDLGAVRIDLAVPVQTWPERWLRRHIDGIGDPAIRAAALRPLEEVVAARDAVANAAGDPDALSAAMSDLQKTFERVTGTPPTRRAGETYAARTLVYEDTVRDVDVRLSKAVISALAGPLGLMLDSARWLVTDVTERYRELFLRLFDGECARTGSDRVPLYRLLLLAAPEISGPSARGLTAIVARSVREFQDRWQAVLQTPQDGRPRHSAQCADIAGGVAAAFPARPVSWSCASQHSPDIMIAAASADALGKGDFLLVLGELHLAVNTLESRCAVEQHAEPARLLDMVTADHGSRRIIAIPDRNSPFVTTRVTPPTALLSPAFTYLANENGSFEPPASAPVLPAGGMSVIRDGEDLMARSGASGRPFPFFEVIGDLMTAVVANAFRPIGPAPHQPRVTIGKVVLSRESWTFSAADAPWVLAKDEAERYAMARQWRTANRLPERIFYKVPAEDKPIGADFRSLPLVNLLARTVRHSRDAGFDSFNVTEMLPDIDRLWLPDAADERYTCELRFVATSFE